MCSFQKTLISLAIAQSKDAKRRLHIDLLNVCNLHPGSFRSSIEEGLLLHNNIHCNPYLAFLSALEIYNLVVTVRWSARMFSLQLVLDFGHDLGDLLGRVGLQERPMIPFYRVNVNGLFTCLEEI